MLHAVDDIDGRILDVDLQLAALGLPHLRTWGIERRACQMDYNRYLGEACVGVRAALIYIFFYRLKPERSAAASSRPCR